MFACFYFIIITIISSSLPTVLGKSSYHQDDLNLEQFISIDQVSSAHSCDLVLFNDQGPQHLVNFLPFQRPTIVFKQEVIHHQGRHNTNTNKQQTNYTLRKNKIEEIHSGLLKFPDHTSAKCYVLVIFGLHTKEWIMSYDQFVERHFNKIKLILIFPLMDNFYIRHYPWKHILDHNVRIIDHTSSRVLFTTTNKFRLCGIKDPICILRGVSKKFGYKNVSPQLHVPNWDDHLAAYPPIELHPRSPSSVLDLFQGLEGQMLKHLVLEYNMNLTLIAPKDMIYGLYFVNNKTGTGIFGLLQRGEVDFIGGMMAGNWERKALGEYLAPLNNIKISFITRKHPKRASWTAPFTVLSESVWAAVFGSFLLVLLFMTSVSKLRAHYYIDEEKIDLCRQRSSDNFTSLILQLAMSALKQPSQKTPGGPASLTFTGWSLCLFIIFSVYSSYLTARLSIPDPERNVDTMRDVWETQRTFIVWPGGTVDLYLKTSSDLDTKHVVNRYLIYSNTIPNYSNIRAVDDYRYVVSGELGAFQYKILAESDGIKRKMRHYHVAKEPLISVFSSWIASKKLCQREGPAISVAILRAWDMGLLTKWSREPILMSVGKNKSIKSTRRISSTHHAENIKSAHQDRKKKLSIDALKGVFLAWVVGILISIVVFLVELIVGVCPKIKPQPPESRQLEFQYCE